MPKEYVFMEKRKQGLFYERITCTCLCGRKYLLLPINDDVVHCQCGQWIDSRAYSLSPTLRAKAEHPKL
jgi:hypothetical protein